MICCDLSQTNAPIPADYSVRSDRRNVRVEKWSNLPTYASQIASHSHLCEEPTQRLVWPDYVQQKAPLLSVLVHNDIISIVRAVTLAHNVTINDCERNQNPPLSQEPALTKLTPPPCKEDTLFYKFAEP